MHADANRWSKVRVHSRYAGTECFPKVRCMGATFFKETLKNAFISYEDILARPIGMTTQALLFSYVNFWNADDLAKNFT